MAHGFVAFGFQRAVNLEAGGRSVGAARLAVAVLGSGLVAHPQQLGERRRLLRVVLHAAEMTTHQVQTIINGFINTKTEGIIKSLNISLQFSHIDSFFNPICFYNFHLVRIDRIQQTGNKQHLCKVIQTKLTKLQKIKIIIHF